MKMHRTPRSTPAAVVLAAALAASGCTSLAPTTTRPAPPVPAAYPMAIENTPAGGAVAAETDWHAFFTDTRLHPLIQAALENNRDLRIAVLNIEQARAQAQVRRADELPTVNAAAGASRQTTTDTIKSTYQAGVAVTSYELDFFGRVKNLSDAALSQVLATEEARKTVQIGLVAAVANGWLAIVADDELLALTRETLRTREESLKLTKLKFDNGVVSGIDLQQAQSLVEAARVTLAQLQRQRATDTNALAQIVGRSEPVPPPTDTSLAAVTLGPELAAGLPSDLLERRPDVRQAERLLAAANANIGATRAAFFPRITLTGTAGSASSELSALFKSGSFGWTFAPQLVLPIFDAGRNQANLEAAQAARDITVAQYERAVQAAFREVADALAGRDTWGEQLRAQQAQAEAEAARGALVDLRYRNGAASYLDVLDAQRSLFAAQQAVLQTRLARLQNRVTLYKVLGGGWTEGTPAAPQARR